MSRQDNVLRTVESCIELINQARLTREEMVLFLSQLLSRIGASIHWGIENPQGERPQRMTYELAKKLYFENPTTGTTILKVAFDLVEVLVHKR